MFGTQILDAALLPALMIALLGGVMSFLSPCVLPIVPPYLAYMAGTTPAEIQGRRARMRVVAAASMFVLGLSTVFLLMGIAASALGRSILQHQDTMMRVSGVLLLIFGAHFVGIYRLRFLDRDLRAQAGQGGTALGAYILGLAFAFGWTPCIGPVLGSILTLAAGQDALAKGGLLLAVYALGLGLPFLLVALFFQQVQPLVRWLTRHLDRVERITGLLLWTIGLMMLTGQFSRFSYLLLETFPALGAVG